MMTEARQQDGDVPNRCRNLGIDGIAIRRPVGKGNAQPAWIASDLLRKRPRRRRCDIGARHFGPMNRMATFSLKTLAPKVVRVVSRRSRSFSRNGTPVKGP